MVGRSAQSGPKTFEELADLATDANINIQVYEFLKI